MGKVAFVLVALGLGIYGFMAYRVATAGGFTETGIRATCAEVLTGKANALYRLSENLEVHRSWLPPSATCVWSGGTSATVVPLTFWSWAGPALLVVGALISLVARIRGRRPRRRQA